MINIGGYNGGHDVTYEYGEPYRLKKLSNDSAIYFMLPADIILDVNKGSRRACVFSFFCVKRGLDGEVSFSLDDIVRWTGKNPRRGVGRINSITLETIKCLENDGYIKTYEEPRDSVRTQAMFDNEKVNKLCNEFTFATIYLDEAKKIFNYQGRDKNDSIDSDILFLVFSYLRMKIARRKNALFQEQVNINAKNNSDYDIEVRKARYPDVFDCHLKEIAIELGLTYQVVSKAVTILHDIGLIYSEALPRTKIGEKWNTNATLFCNYYNRSGKKLLVEGEEYYMIEIQNKKDRLNKFKRAKK